MYLDKTQKNELAESSSNFDPLLSQEMRGLIRSRESYDKRNRKQQSIMATVQRLDEFEQAML